MVPHTVVALGYSNVSVAQIRGLFSKEERLGEFEVLLWPQLYDEARPYELGKAEAQEMAVQMATRYRAPLCIGVVCVRFLSPNPAFQSGKVDIAMVVERGTLLEHEIQLNPKSCRGEMLEAIQREGAFAHEAGYQLLELIRVRQRSLLLEHF